MDRASLDLVNVKRGALGVSKPENPEENWDKPENQDYLSFNNCFKNFTH